MANEAINIFVQACCGGLAIDGHVIASVLKACCTLAAFQEGQAVYGFIIEESFDADVFIINSLVSLYAQCGCIEDARHLFEKCSRLDVVTWGILIGQHVKNGHFHEALQLYLQMVLQDVKPDNVMFTIVFNACASASNVEQGLLVHDQFIQSGLKPDTYVENSVVDMYAKCGSLEDARHAFLTSHHTDMVAYTAMMTGFTNYGRAQEALEMFWQMQKKDVEPNHFTLACALKACSDSGELCQGKVIHACTIFYGYDDDKFVRSTLINLYSKYESLEDAYAVFDRLPTRRSVDWSMMISGSALQKHGQESVHMHLFMQEKGLNLDRISFTDMLKACSTSMCDEARLIHMQIVESNFACDKFVGASLINAYVRCRLVEDARRVFDQLSNKDIVTWGVMMTGYVDCGLSQEVLTLLQELEESGIELNHINIGPSLKACSILMALDEGKLIHSAALEAECELNLFVGSSLINMYSKCGSLFDACRVFECLPKKNVVIWTAIIGGCAHLYEHRLAFQYFEGMERAGVKPDEQVFMCLLSACNHVGLADSCHLHLISMSDKYGIAPTLDHVNCVADVLARAGQVKEAKYLLETKTQPDNIVGWMSLLSHSQTYGNLNEANKCLERIIMFDRKHAAGYTIMSKVYATSGMWENADMLLSLKGTANAWKKYGEAFIELNNKVHGFSVGMRICPQVQEKLQRLRVHIQEIGYVS